MSMWPRNKMNDQVYSRACVLFYSTFFLFFVTCLVHQPSFVFFSFFLSIMARVNAQRLIYTPMPMSHKIILL